MNPSISTEENEPSLDHLNEQQREAVRHSKGVLLINAGAGSGKTRVIIERIRYLVEYRKARPNSILAITFTNKAANEMKERIEKLEIKGPHISTFHSLCVRILRENTEFLDLDNDNFSIFDSNDQKTLLNSIIREMQLDKKEHPVGPISSRISLLKNQGLGPDDAFATAATPGDRIFSDIFLKYEEALKTNQAFDFDDLLLKVLKLFKNHDKVLQKYRNRYRHILVDEYQDTNAVQFDLIKYLYCDKTESLVLTGDPDQSIYSWRGAEISNILKFQEHFKDGQTIVLDTNYRSTKHILNLANQVIRHNAKRLEKSLRTDNDEGPKPRLHRLATDEEEAETVARIIQEKKAAGIKGKDIAVFYRTNAQSAGIEAILNREGIPYILVGATRFYERAEIKDVMAYLRFLQNNSDSISLMRAINTPRRGIGNALQGKIRSFADSAGCTCWEAILSEDFMRSLPARSKNALESFRGIIIKLSNLYYAPPIELLKTLYEETKLPEFFAEQNDDRAEERKSNLDEFASQIGKFSASHPDENLSGLLDHISLVSGNEAEEEANEVKMGDKVILMTLHAAKGLEFPVVLFTGLDDGIMPHMRALMEGGEDSIEEERRLCYVGITRAERELHLFTVKERFQYSEPKRYRESRFISEMQGDNFDSSDDKSRDMESVLRQKLKSSSDSRFFPTQKVIHDKFASGTVVKVDKNKKTALCLFPRFGLREISVDSNELQAR